MKENNPGSSYFKKILFLEITGFLGLLLTVAAMWLLISTKVIEIKNLYIPAIGFLIIFTFIGLSIRYARRDLHKIHELHNNRFYHIGRYVVYALGWLMIGYTIYMYFTHKDLFINIGYLIEAQVVLILGILVIYYTYTMGFLIDNEHLRHKTTNFWDVFWVIIFPFLLVAGSAYYVFTKEAETTTKGKPDFEMNAAHIIAEFEKNDTLSETKYVGKSIKFSARILEISGDSSIVIKLNSGVEGYTVNCGFDKSLKDTVIGLNPGDSVVLQCSCSGLQKPDEGMDLLSDKSLEMTRCNLLQKILLKPSVGTDIEHPMGNRDTLNKKNGGKNEK